MRSGVSLLLHQTETRISRAPDSKLGNDGMGLPTGPAGPSGSLRLFGGEMPSACVASWGQGSNVLPETGSFRRTQGKVRNRSWPAQHPSGCARLAPVKCLDLFRECVHPSPSLAMTLSAAVVGPIPARRPDRTRHGPSAPEAERKQSSE